MASPHSLQFSSSSLPFQPKRNSATQLPLPEAMQSAPSSPQPAGRVSPSVSTTPSRPRLPLGSPTSSSFPIHTSSTHAGGIQPSASFFRPSKPNYYSPPDSPASSQVNTNQDRDVFPLSTLKRHSDSMEHFSDDDGHGEAEAEARESVGVKPSRLPIGGEGGPRVAIVSTTSMGNDRTMPQPRSAAHRLRNSIDMVFNLGRGLSMDSRRSQEGSRATLSKRVPSASSEGGYDSIGYSDTKKKIHDEERGYPSSHFARNANSHSVSSSPEPPVFISGPNRVDSLLPPIPADYIPSDKAEYLFAVPMYTKHKKPKLVYNYQLHPSRNRFFLRGRILTGGDTPWAFVASFSIVSAIAGLWFGTTCPWWWHAGDQLGKGGSVGGKVLVCIGGYMTLLVLVSMLKTATSDPGILPRDLDPDPPYSSGLPFDEVGRIALPRDLKVRADVVRVKYCSTCKTYRPPRSSHCKMCDNCVDGCDHHCQWVNNCIGRRNYTTFFVLLLSATITLLLVIATSIVHLYFLTKDSEISFRHVIRSKQGGGSAAAFCLSVVVIWPVTALFSYHVRLLLLNVTTIEQIRNQAHKTLVPGPPPPNPFSHGSWGRNMMAVLWRPSGYSWLNGGGIATEDKREINPGRVVAAPPP